MVSKPRSKEEIVECDDSSGVEGDGSMDDEDPQTDEMEVNSTKESSDDDMQYQGKPAVTDKENINKLIQLSVKFLVFHQKKESLGLLKENCKVHSSRNQNNPD